MTTEPMKPATIRRKMRQPLETAALAASQREERIALGTLRQLVTRGIIGTAA